MKTLRLPIALQQAVMRSLRHHLSLANQHLEKEYPLPEVLYQQRGTTAGTAWLQSWQIRLNPVLLMENGQAFVDEVVPHELAHLLVWKHFGRVAPHGREWKWMMQTVLGVPAKSTHRFDTESLQKTFAYRCACRHHRLTVRRHNKVVRGETRYRCNDCNGELKPDPTDPA